MIKLVMAAAALAVGVDSNIASEREAFDVDAPTVQTTVYSHDRDMALPIAGQWTSASRDGEFATLGDRIDFGALPFMTFDFIGGVGLIDGLARLGDAATDRDLAFSVDAEAVVTLLPLGDRVDALIEFDHTADGPVEWRYLAPAADGVVVVAWYWPEGAPDDKPDADFKVELSRLVTSAFVGSDTMMHEARRQSRAARLTITP